MGASISVLLLFDLLWGAYDCGLVWDLMVCGIFLEEGTILNEMALISTVVTGAALNGLNVTMGYCIRLGFKVQSPDLLFLILLNCKFKNVL